MEVTRLPGIDGRMTRRQLLRLGAAAAAASALPLSAGRPLLRAAAAAPRRPGSRPFPDRPAGTPNPDLTPELANIDHIILVMMENHSFDAYFGMLPHRVPELNDRVDGFAVLGADGRPEVYQTDSRGTTYRAFPMPDGCQPGGVSQSWRESHRAYDHGRMDGFCLYGGQGEPVGYWDERILPFYYSLASQFVVCDRYFCSTLCQTYPNRVFAMAATAAGLVSTDTPPPTVTPANGHIFDVLDAHGIGWADYYTNLPTPGLFGPPYVVERQGRNFFGPFGAPDATAQAFTAAMRAGALPPFVMVETDYQYASEENPQDIRAGQHFVAAVINALFSVPQVWARSLLIFTYDEHGGYYDHVPPPPALSPGDGSHPDLPQSEWFGDDYTRLGFRVPTVVVSPWARRGFTSHTVYDHGSILATLQRKWNLPALTYRDANANHMGDCLVQQGPPPFAEPPQLASAEFVTEVESVRCENQPGYAQPLNAKSSPPPAPPAASGAAAAAAMTGTPNTASATGPAWTTLGGAVTAVGVAARRRRRRPSSVAPATATDPSATPAPDPGEVSVLGNPDTA